MKTIQMKKFMMLALVLTTITISSFAAETETVSKLVLSSFNKSYGKAEQVKWESSRNFVKATFRVDGQLMYAYYRHNGQQIAVSRNILPAVLPGDLGQDLRSMYHDRWLTDLFEITANGETFYFATLETADEVLILKADAIDGWTEFKTNSKSH